MKCPYAVNRRVITQSEIELDENGNQTSWTEVQNNSASFLDCLRDECGAYNRLTGKCEYKT